MSLMNDALRKRKKEKKDSPNTVFYQKSSGKQQKRNYKIYGIVAILMLSGAIAGFYVYEYVSLTGPVRPPLKPPTLTETSSSPVRKLYPVVPEKDMSKPIHTETKTEPSSGQPKSTPSTAAARAENRLEVLKPEKQEVSSAVRTIKADQKKPSPAIQRKSAFMEQATSTIDAPKDKNASPGTVPSDSHGKPMVETADAASGIDPVEELFYQKAISYHRQHNLKMAIRMYREVLRKNPEHQSALFNLASVYIETSAFSEAHLILNNLYNREPNNPEIMLNLAIANIGLDKPDQAIGLLDQVEKAFGSPRFEILFHRGAAYSRMGENEKAIEWYQRAEKLDPDNPHLSLNSAIAYDRLAQYGRAIDHYRAFLNQISPSNEAERRRVESRIRELQTYISQRAKGS